MNEEELKRQRQRLVDATSERKAAIAELDSLQSHDHSCDSPRIEELQAEISGLTSEIEDLHDLVGDPEMGEDDEDEHEGEVYCPICGGFGGESYGSDFGTCEECGGTGYVDENWGEGSDEDEDDEEVSREHQYGVFEMWEDDVAELIVKPEALGGLGACEPEELAAMDVSGMEALSNIILGLYHQWKAGTTNLVWSRDVECIGEIDDETLERGENYFATYLTFDCRQWLKQEGGEQQ